VHVAVWLFGVHGSPNSTLTYGSRVKTDMSACQNTSVFLHHLSIAGFCFSFFSSRNFHCCHVLVFVFFDKLSTPIVFLGDKLSGQNERVFTERHPERSQTNGTYVNM